jgi:hypothetical protein
VQAQTAGLSEEVMAWTVSTMEPWSPDRYKSLTEAMIDNGIFIPLFFRGGLFPKIDYSYSRDSLFANPLFANPYGYVKDFAADMFKSHYISKELEDLAYREVMLKDPRNFRYRLPQRTERAVRQESIYRSNERTGLNVKSTTVSPEKVDPVIKFIPDRRYWTSTFSADVKFSQNRSSANWHKGEINNMNIYTNAVITYNYAKDKLSLKNTLSAMFTINNAPNDTLRKYTVGSDELRFLSVFGLQAIRNWNYTISGEFVTSMGNKYIANTENLNSAFLSPYTVNLSIGMTYGLKPKFQRTDRSLDMQLTLAPFSFKYMYSSDRDINLGAFFQKNEDGTYERVLKTFGSAITMNKTTKFNKSVAWKSRFYYFTNYERIIGEFENTVDISLSRYFSTTLYLYLRYDDGVAKKEESDSYLQINELFSFGFSYRW